MKIDNIDFIKVDIEGAELLCLKGGIDKLLTEFKPEIIIEVYEEYCARFNYCVYDLLNLLDNAWYALLNYDDNQWYATAVRKNEINQ